MLDENVIKYPVTVENKASKKIGGLAFTRQINLAQFGYGEVGNLPQNDIFNGELTSKITIITDGFGNLKNVFPGFLNSLDR